MNAATCLKEAPFLCAFRCLDAKAVTPDNAANPIALIEFIASLVSTGPSADTRWLLALRRPQTHARSRAGPEMVALRGSSRTRSR